MTYLRPAPLARAALILAALALSACRADVDHLETLVPDGLAVTERLGSDARRFNCQRATFRAVISDPTSMEDWTRLGSLYRRPMLACLDVEEQIRWNQAIAAQTAVWRIVTRPEKAHLWYDTESGRLQVLTLINDR